MPINPELLIAAPMLQDYLVDKTTVLPLANGKIFLYQDNSRTTFKNWYYQSGTPGAYTYITLPNPLTLSAVGTITDINGVDTIPFYYPYSEADNVTPQPYFIKVFDSNGQLQFTRQNFPYNPNNSPVETSVATLKNLITNNEFWRNIGTINATNLAPNASLGVVGTVIAPSQHDGFSMPDIQFIKDVNGSVDTLSFFNFASGNNSFPDQIIPDSITPEYYLNMNCTVAGTESVKYVQIPIQLHVTALSGVQNCSITIGAMNVSGSVNNRITVSILQFLGTGVTSPEPFVIDSFPLTTSWDKYTVSFGMPSAQDLVLGNGLDDAFYLQIGYPAAVTSNINIALPGFYLSEETPTNDWQTYDEINAVISSSRTGDVRTAMNQWANFGWVSMNDGTLGNTTSNATCRANADTFRLYSNLWNQFTSVDHQVFAPMYTSAGTPIAYGASAIADFNANNALSLTKMLGRVVTGVIPFQVTDTFTASGNILTLSTLTDRSFFNNGIPVRLNTTGTLPAPLILGQTYYTILLGGSTLSLALTPELAIAGTAIVLSTAGTGTQTIIATGLPAGIFYGENLATLGIPNMPSHSHPGSFWLGDTITLGGGASNALANINGSTSLAVNVAPQGGTAGVTQAFSIVQPTVFYNVYMKL